MSPDVVRESRIQPCLTSLWAIPIFWHVLRNITGSKLQKYDQLSQDCLKNQA